MLKIRTFLTEVLKIRTFFTEVLKIRTFFTEVLKIRTFPYGGIDDSDVSLRRY